jgi:hypothetical protein
VPRTRAFNLSLPSFLPREPLRPACLFGSLSVAHFRAARAPVVMVMVMVMVVVVRIQFLLLFEYLRGSRHRDPSVGDNIFLVVEVGSFSSMIAGNNTPDPDLIKPDFVVVRLVNSWFQSHPNQRYWMFACQW